MAKIAFDKYYTPVYLAKYCIDKTFEVIGKENITDIIEPSAGAGAFSHQLDCTAYDIAPDHNSIIKQDYLALDLGYKKGRLAIGNPPYGRSSNLAVQFFKKSIKFADYVSFILPVTFFENEIRMYEFDLVHSEVLKDVKYSGKKVMTCLNIFRRPATGILNKKKNYKLEDVEIYEYRRGINGLPKIFDYGINNWGSGIGKEVKIPGVYAHELFFIIKNKKLKKRILKLVKETDWRNIFVHPKSITFSVAIWRIYKYLKEQIPELK